MKIYSQCLQKRSSSASPATLLTESELLSTSTQIMVLRNRSKWLKSALFVGLRKGHQIEMLWGRVKFNSKFRYWKIFFLLQFLLATFLRVCSISQTITIKFQRREIIKTLLQNKSTPLSDHPPVSSSTLLITCSPIISTSAWKVWRYREGRDLGLNTDEHWFVWGREIFSDNLQDLWFLFRPRTKTCYGLFISLL